MDLWPILFIVGIIAIITFIILGVGEMSVPANQDVGPQCLNDSDCSSGYRCQNGQCKVRIGGSCSALNDCVRGAVSCYQGRCLLDPRNGVGEPCPCQSGLVCSNGFCQGPTGGTCRQNSDCPSGYVCLNGTCVIGPTGVTGCTGEELDDGSDDPDDVEVDASTYKKPQYLNRCRTDKECPDQYSCSPMMVYQGYRNGNILPVISIAYLPPENAIDMTVYRDTIYVLLEGGDIVRVKDHVPIRIRTSLPFIQIFTFTGHLYGLYDGRIYIANKSISRWDCLDHLEGIVGISLTLDQKNIWIQCIQKAYVYDREWKNVETVKLHPDHTKRIHGLTTRDWVDLYSNTAVTSSGQQYSNVSTCAVTSSGQVLLPPYEDVVTMKLVRFGGEYVPFFILSRGCTRI